MEFKCKNCGLCCSKESLDHSNKSSIQEFPSFSKSQFILFCRKPTLQLFPWEAEKLKELNPSLNILPYKVIFDLNTNTTIILEYTFEETDCPFHKNNSCSIYKDRPLLCQSFPAVNGSLKELLSKQTRITLSGCPNDYNENEWKEFCKINNQKSQFIKALHERYKNSYLAKLELDKINYDIDHHIQQLIQNNHIRPAKQGYDPKLLLKRINNSKQVPITEFLNYSEEQINEIKELKWSTSFIKPDEQ